MALIDGIAKLRWAVCQKVARAKRGNAQPLGEPSKDMHDVCISNTLIALFLQYSRTEPAPSSRQGGIVNALRGLMRQKLVHHDNQKYDGYRLTSLGYDFLALKALVNRGAISAVGRQIGVGKESDVFEVISSCRDSCASRSVSDTAWASKCRSGGDPLAYCVLHPDQFKKINLAFWCSSLYPGPCM